MKTYLAICALSLLPGCQLLDRPEQSPEEFAATAMRAVAMNDFGAYAPLCARASDNVASTGAKSLAATLDPLQTEQIRQQFESAVRSNRLRAHAIDVYEPRLRAKEHERWVYDIHDANGANLGVQFVFKRVGPGYQIVQLNLI